jgi:glycosyltransferase involved in cell wall biosynthesis
VSDSAEGAGFLILNPEARKQIGEAARKKIEAELTWDAVAKKYLEMFEEAIRLRAGAATASEGSGINY